MFILCVVSRFTQIITFRFYQRLKIRVIRVPKNIRLVKGQWIMYLHFFVYFKTK